jgi:hypothetical protein
MLAKVVVHKNGTHFVSQFRLFCCFGQEPNWYGKSLSSGRMVGHPSTNFLLMVVDG